MIDKEYVEEFAKLAGTMYSVGLSAWIAGGSYASTFSEYDKDTSALFVSRFSSISAIQVEMQRIKKSIDKIIMKSKFVVGDLNDTGCQ